MSFFDYLSAQTWTLLATAFALLVLYGVSPYGYFKKLGIPGPRPLPFLGTCLSYRKGFQHFDMECFHKYGSIWGIFDGRKPLLMITDSNMIKAVMVKECYTYFTNRRDGIMAGPLADGLSLVKDEKWRRIRSVLSPIFTSGRLKEVFPIAIHYADIMMASLKKRNLEEPVQIKEIVGPYSLDVITSASFSVDIDSINNPNDPFVSNIKKILKFSFYNPLLWIITMLPFTTPIFEKLGLSLLENSSINFFYKALRKIKDHQNSILCLSRVDFLQLMIESQISDQQAEAKATGESIKGLTDHEILSQSLIFIFGGYETTGSTLTLLVYNLATNPDTMRKLQEEIDRVFPDNAPVLYEALMQMEYLDMAINESMRLWSPAPRIERACKQTVEIHGVTIPSDTLVVVPTYVLHRDPKIWESPETFKPERFSKENRESIDPYTFLPFGTGPRNCIGMRFALMIMKLAVVKLLQNFDFETCKETQIPLELNTLYQPKQPITLKLVPRKSLSKKD
uniref:unspecific monooxygenase n=1 Tax=Scleropages formosus TaxID=113540 RepID=A0A8C9W478_SCLFO